MSAAYDIAMTVINFCKKHGIHKSFAEELITEIRCDLEWDDDYSIACDYVRYNWDE